MNVEYSYYGKNPRLIIKGTEFIKSFNNDEELYLLEVAVDGFGAKFDVVSHFDERVNAAIKQWVTKTGEVLYVIKDRTIGRSTLDTWCEVYVRNGSRLIEIVISDNGRQFSLNEQEEY